MKPSTRIVAVLALAAACTAALPSRSSAQEHIVDANTLSVPQAMQWPKPTVPLFASCPTCVSMAGVTQMERTRISASDDGELPKWTYPVIGGFVGGIAGWLYVDRFGGENGPGTIIPVELVFPVLGAAAGAVVGAIVAHVTP